MNIAKFALAAFAAAGLAATAQAQEMAAGATVYGPEGNPVGTVTSVAGGNVVLDTGTHEATLPAASFGEGEQGPTITVTQAQLNAMLAEQAAAAEAQLDAALVETAVVTSADGQDAGVVESIDGDTVILANEAGDVSLMREHFTVNAEGQLMALYTLAQIQTAAAGGATAAPAAAAAGE